MEANLQLGKYINIQHGSEFPADVPDIIKLLTVIQETVCKQLEYNNKLSADERKAGMELEHFGVELGQFKAFFESAAHALEVLQEFYQKEILKPDKLLIKLRVIGEIILDRWKRDYL